MSLGRSFLFRGPRHGLAARYPFRAGTGSTAKDSTGGGNDLTLTASPTWTLDNGVYHLSFNGTTQYGVTPALVWTVGSEWGFMAWAKCPATTLRMVVSSAPSGDPTAYISTGNSDNSKLRVWSNDAVNSSVVESTHTAFDDSWHHLVGTLKSDGTIYAYVDSQVTSAAGTATALTSTAKVLNIGCRNSTTTPSEFFPGEIQDVRIFNRYVTAAEVAEIYRQGRSV